jgi:small-conductance mechanosensitive channel
MIKIGRILSILQWVLLAISAILVVSLMMNISENEADPTMGSWINTNLIWTYILLAIGAGVAVIAGLLHTATDASAAKQGLISLGFAAVVLVLAYVFASDAIPTFHGVEKYIADGTLTPRISKLIGTGLYATYILLFLAIAGIALSSVSKLFK